MPDSTAQDYKSSTRASSFFIREARRFADVCDLIAGYMLFASAFLFLFIVVLAVNGRGEWDRVPLVIALFLFSLVVGFTLLLLSRITGIGLGWIGIILGLLLANCSLVLAVLSSQLHFSLINSLFFGLSKTAPTPGVYLIVVSVLHLLFSNIYYIFHSRQLAAEYFSNKEKHAEGSKKAFISFIPKCWQMYACPEAARAKCPNFIDSVSCWKRRRGCLCDHKLSAHLFHSTPIQKIEQLEGAASVNPQDYFLSRFRSAPKRSWRERKPFCHNCALFLEHQAYKYRGLNWLFFPISLIALIFTYPYYHIAYNYGAARLDDFANYLANSGHLPEGFYSDASQLTGSYFEFLVFAVLALLVMSYIVEITDWFLLEVKA